MSWKLSGAAAWLMAGPLADDGGQINHRFIARRLTMSGLPDKKPSLAARATTEGVVTNCKTRLNGRWRWVAIIRKQNQTGGSGGCIAGPAFVLLRQNAKVNPLLGMDFGNSPVIERIRIKRGTCGVKRRFQIYLRMVDVSFWVSAVFLTNFVAKMFGYHLFRAFGLIGPLSEAVATANQVLAVCIVLAWFMRDEHAERLWQLTARRFVNVMMASCALIGLVLPIIESRIDGFVASRDWSLPPEFNVAMFTASQAMVKGMVGGIGIAIMAFGYFAPLIFIVLYKWALWRDSR